MQADSMEMESVQLLCKKTDVINRMFHYIQALLLLAFKHSLNYLTTKSFALEGHSNTRQRLSLDVLWLCCTHKSRSRLPGLTLCTL